MATYWQALRSFSPSLRRFLIASALVTTVFFGIMAVLQNLYLLRLGYDARFIGLALGVGQMVWAATALPAAALGRRIGLRNAILLGYALDALAVSLYLSVESRPADLWNAWIVGCQALMMVGAALITVSIAPYLMAITRDEERKYAFGVFQATIPATAFVGSLIAGVLPGLLARVSDVSLADPDPYRMALWVGPILLILAILPMFGADPGKLVAHQKQKASTDRAPLLLLAVFGTIVYLAAIGEGILRSFFNVYLNADLDVPPAQIGAIMGVAQLLPIAAALSAPLLMARIGTGPALVTAILTMSAILLPMALFPVVWVAALGFMTALAAIAVLNTVRDLLGQEFVTPRWRTTIAGVLIIGLALGWATAGLVGGYLIETIGFGALFAFGAIMGAFSAALLIGMLRSRPVSAPAEVADAALP